MNMSWTHFWFNLLYYIFIVSGALLVNDVMLLSSEHDISTLTDEIIPLAGDCCEALLNASRQEEVELS